VGTPIPACKPQRQCEGRGGRARWKLRRAPAASGPRRGAGCKQGKRAGADVCVRQIAARVLELCLAEMSVLNAVQTDPNFSNFVWDTRARQVRACHRPPADPGGR
jgi:hypothetical protein